MDHETACGAAARFLELMGYYIMERDWAAENGEHCDLVATKDGELVFVDVEGCAEADEFPPPSPRDPERLYVAYARKSDAVGVSMRRDVVQVMPLQRGRAHIRRCVSFTGEAA